MFVFCCGIELNQIELDWLTRLESSHLIDFQIDVNKWKSDVIAEKNEFGEMKWEMDNENKRILKVFSALASG